MGLLDRAGAIESCRVTAGNSADTARRILQEFACKPEFLDYPAGVFQAFCEAAGIVKGALLFPDSARGEYSPWIVRKLDQTSTRRLRIPFDYPPLARAPHDDMVIHLSTEEISPMLSTREAGLKNSPVLIRTGAADNPAALILALESDFSPASRQNITGVCRILEENFIEGIQKNRSIFAGTAPAEENTSVAEWLDATDTIPGVAAILDTSDALSALKETVPGLDTYRVQQDVVNMLRRLTGRMGRFLNLKDGRVLICFPEARLPDQSLYLHQLTGTFTDSVRQLNRAPVFHADFLKWPDEKETLKHSLSGCLTV